MGYATATSFFGCGTMLYGWRPATVDRCCGSVRLGSNPNDPGDMLGFVRVQGDAMREFFKGWRRKLGGVALVMGLAYAVVLVVAWRDSANYPFGHSHCCDKALYMALLSYADRHNGDFPSGEGSPEASLSLLYAEQLADANLLRGKSVLENTVQEILDRGELLDPESCGWHYVERLNKDDDGRLALFWDKEGLDHNGGRLAKGGHIVWFLNSEHPYITAAEWPGFLAEQKKLHQQREKSRKE